jgi:hypothetical protein
MIISEILGGLGNQLFEYAAARRMTIEFNQELKLDLTFFDRYHIPDVFRLDKFNVTYEVATDEEIKKLKRFQKSTLPYKVLRKVKRRPVYLNRHNHFDNMWFYANDWKKKLSMKDNFYVSGYFADPVFFYEIEDILLKEFTLKGELNEANKVVLKKIQETNSVSLHIRRGDYVNNPVFANLPLSYYLDAAGRFLKEDPHTTFFVFSDDLKWAQENLKLEGNMEFVGINDASTDYMELMLMAACNNNIIANSTFSWWGAWLNKNPDKTVYAPALWFSDPERQKRYANREIYQKGWQRI